MKLAPLLDDFFKRFKAVGLPGLALTEGVVGKDRVRLVDDDVQLRR